MEQKEYIRVEKEEPTETENPNEKTDFVFYAVNEALFMTVYQEWSSRSCNNIFSSPVKPITNESIRKVKARQLARV